MTCARGKGPLFAAVIFWSLVAGALCSGCATPQATMMKITGSAAVTVAGAYHGLDLADEDEQAKIRAQAKQDARAADAALNAWLTKHRVGRQVLDSAAAVVRTAWDAVPLVTAKTLPEWIARVTAVGVRVMKELAAMGVKITAAGGAP